MKPVYAAFSIILLVVLAAAVPVMAGGWAVITLEELPAGVSAGAAVSVRFSVRQHGRTLLEGLEASVHARNTGSGESIDAPASAVEGQPGYYEAALTFPSEGAWEWSINAFGMDQPMPELSVAGRALASQPLPAPPSPAAIAAGLSGLLLAGVAAFIALRKRARWAVALVILGLAIGGASFASAASQLGKDNSSPETAVQGAEPSASPVDTGKALFIAKGCVACHSNARVERRYAGIFVGIGPDLSRFSASPEYLRMWLDNPSAVKPGVEMPDLDLDEAEIEALITFINTQAMSDK